MKSNAIFIGICLLLPALCRAIPAQNATSGKDIRLSSPGGAIVFSFGLIEGTAQYHITYKGRELIGNSELSLSFRDEPPIERNLKIGHPAYRAGEENYDLKVGKTSHVDDHYREVDIPIEERESPFRRVNLLVRVFNEGVAFRYQFPARQDRDSLILTGENTHFRLIGDPIVRALFLPDYTSSHEGEYTRVTWEKTIPDSLMDMPALFEFPGQAYLAITEAALLDYAGMYLVKHDGVLTGKLSPWPGQAEVKVRAALPHHSPWRVMLISDRIGDLIESNIITDLNEPCRIADQAWIKPGKTSFPWWNGNVVPDTLNAPGNNFVTQKYYIDFCARAGLEYHSVVEYGLHEWYVNDGAGFVPGPHADPGKAVPGLDMQEVCDYGRQHGVGIRVWTHWAALYPKLDATFAQYEKWGIRGLMVDFMDRDDQPMVNMQTEILQKAAIHHLHIQFHGAYKPTGLSRTYPNELTREGTLNYEADKWSDRINADHDINFPFTRMLAGPTDYHLGGFRAVPDSAFVIQFTRPLVMGTRCHMLAMYVVLESYLSMVCDYPAAYEGQPGFEFLREVPTVWDETRVLDAEVGEYILIARRKGTDWFIGGITNHKPRTLKVPLSFLRTVTGQATVYSDAADARIYPNHLDKWVAAVTSADTLSVTLAPGGGLAIHIRPAR
ncbi:MAG: glycoside hydrolase family 97 protein [Bacteroidota bacterium]|nr:glycoside hydrolase family 97 protein [Bacteroidota bacterium]